MNKLIEFCAQKKAFSLRTTPFVFRKSQIEPKMTPKNMKQKIKVKFKTPLEKNEEPITLSLRDERERTKNQKYKVVSKTPLKLSICQWNARSINNECKTHYIRGLNTDIVAVQEIWQKGTNLKRDLELIDLAERTTKRGGGTAVIKNLKCLNVQKCIRINKDSNMLRINFQNSYFWLINLYFNKGKISKIQKLFGIIRQHIPQNEISQLIIVGDFNIDLNETETQEFILLTKLCKQTGIRIESPQKNTRKNAMLDFLICGKNILIKSKNYMPSLSDHLAITWQLEISFPEKIKQLKIPSKNLFQANSVSKLGQVGSALSFE